MDANGGEIVLEVDANGGEIVLEVNEGNDGLEVELPMQRERLPVLYCLRTRPPMWYTILLAFYLYIIHLVACLTLLGFYPFASQEDIGELLQAVMFVSGWSTLLQCSFGSRLPIVVGASPQYLIPIYFTIALKSPYIVGGPQESAQTLVRAIQGAHIVCSIFQILLGFCGLWRAVLLLLSPLSAVPLVGGLGLGFYKRSFNELGNCLEIGIPMLIVITIISVYMPRLHARGRKIYEKFGLLLSVVIIWLYTVILNSSGVYSKSPLQTRISCEAGRLALIKASLWFKIPYPFQWGRPTFDIGVISIMLAGTIVSTIEVFLLSGIFGTLIGPAPSNVSSGFVGWTRIASRRVVQICALFMIVFSMFGKFQAILASVPPPIILAVSCICYGYGVSGGFGLLQHCNLNSSRTRLILGWSFFFAFSVPYFLKGKKTFIQDPYVDLVVRGLFLTLFLSEATVGVLVAFFFDRTLSFSDPRTQRENGFSHWARYARYGETPGSEEDYALPFGLDEWFRPL